MSLNIDKKDDGHRQVMILLVNSLRKNVHFKPMVNDYTKIDSYKSYIFSRYSEKLSSIAANYIRIEWALKTLKFKEVDHIETDDLSRLKDESDIELITTILRPLTEIYLEIKAIELTLDKHSIDLEQSCQLIYFDSLTQSYQLKRNISNEVYDCDPKYFKIWCDLNLKELSKVKQQLSESDIPFLKNVRGKYKSIIENYGQNERIVLGYDYFSHYAIMSKKAHFSYTNVPFSYFKPNFYLTWCTLYFILIYEMCMRLLDKEDELSKLVNPLAKSFSENSSAVNLNHFSVGDFVCLEFGIAKLIGASNLTYEIEYTESNCFKRGETDFIPKIFIIGKVDMAIYKNAKTKFLNSDQDIYSGKEYEDFFMEIFKHSQPKQIDLDEIIKEKTAANNR